MPAIRAPHGWDRYALRSASAGRRSGLRPQSGEGMGPPCILRPEWNPLRLLDGVRRHGRRVPAREECGEPASGGVWFVYRLALPWCRPGDHLGCGSVALGRMHVSNGRIAVASRLGSGWLPDPARGWRGEGLWVSAPGGLRACDRVGVEGGAVELPCRWGGAWPACQDALTTDCGCVPRP